MLLFYRHIIRPGDLCFDVGANVGNRSEVFLRLGARVVAVEPQAACMKELQRKLGRNKNVTLVQKALGEEAGEHQMIISNASTISSMSKEWIESVRLSGRFAGYRWDTTVTAPVTTLEHLIEAHGSSSCIHRYDGEGGRNSRYGLLPIQFDH